MYPFIKLCRASAFKRCSQLLILLHALHLPTYTLLRRRPSH